jgi:hypothetical protein
LRDFREHIHDTGNRWLNAAGIVDGEDEADDEVEAGDAFQSGEDDVEMKVLCTGSHMLRSHIPNSLS